MANYSCDNHGNKMPNTPFTADPVLASGLSAAAATAGDDYTQTVEAGATYACTALVGSFLMSLTGVTSTAANIEWVCPKEQTIIIKVPTGYTTLYFEANTNSSTLYMRKITID